MQHIDISEKLKILMTKHNMSLSEFAKFTEISRTSLSGYINNKVTPTIDPMVQICKKCDVSMDWLCSNPNTHKFTTGTDIIDLFLELSETHDFNFEITSKADPDDSCRSIYSFSMENCSRSSNDDSAKFFDVADLVDFFKEYSELKKKLEHLNDDEIKMNYFEMWLDKKREHYSHYAVLYERDYEEKMEKELEDAFEDFRKLFASSNSESGDK